MHRARLRRRPARSPRVPLSVLPPSLCFPSGQQFRSVVLRIAQVLATARSPLLRMSTTLWNLGGDRGMSDDYGKSQQRPKPRKPFLSIRAWLIVLALLAIAPLMLERVHGLERARVDRMERANNEATELAWRGVEAHREIIYSVRALVQIVSLVYAKVPLETPNCNQYLTDLTVNIPWIRDVSVATTVGRI